VCYYSATGGDARGEGEVPRILRPWCGALRSLLDRAYRRNNMHFFFFFFFFFSFLPVGVSQLRITTDALMAYFARRAAPATRSHARGLFCLEVENMPPM